MERKRWEVGEKDAGNKTRRKHKGMEGTALDICSIFISLRTVCFLNEAEVFGDRQCA